MTPYLDLRGNESRQFRARPRMVLVLYMLMEILKVTMESNLVEFRRQ